MNKGMFSSDSSEWETPQWLFDKYDAIFHFDLDVCATKENAKCKRYFDKKMDGLKQEWHKASKTACWMNPPYGREIGKWVQKAWCEAREGATVVCLLPARTDTGWFHDFCFAGGTIRFLRGRLKFSNSKNSAPFPSMVVIFGGDRVVAYI